MTLLYRYNTSLYTRQCYVLHLFKVISPLSIGIFVTLFEDKLTCNLLTVQQKRRRNQSRIAPALSGEHTTCALLYSRVQRGTSGTGEWGTGNAAIYYIQGLDNRCKVSPNSGDTIPNRGMVMDLARSHNTTKYDTCYLPIWVG